jgi:hypothetical protein
LQQLPAVGTNQASDDTAHAIGCIRAVSVRPDLTAIVQVSGLGIGERFASSA